MTARKPQAGRRVKTKVSRATPAREQIHAARAHPPEGQQKTLAGLEDIADVVGSVKGLPAGLERQPQEISERVGLRPQPAALSEGHAAVARTVLEVFLSSTAADLKPHRDGVYARLARIEFFKCVRQEDFGTQNAEAVQYCCDKARSADLFVGMIGLRRGWEPHGDNANRSITEMEYDCAKDAGLRRYLWVSPDDFPVPGNLRESDGEHERQLAFRRRVMSGGERIVSQKGFASSDSLASEIVEQLLAHVVTGDLIKLLRPELGQAGAVPVEDQKPAIAAAVEKLAEDKDVDLLVLARNPQGVDVANLEAKLKARAETHEAAGQGENKKSAEYWRHLGALAFLHNTQRALAAYDKAVALDPNEPEGWRYLGELQHRLGNWGTAARAYDTLQQLGLNLQDKQIQSLATARLSELSLSRGDIVASEAAATSALQLAESIGWSEGIARAANDLGNVHLARRSLDRAEAMYLHSLGFNESVGNKLGIATLHGNLGLIHEARGDLDKAEDALLKALKLNNEIGRKEGEASAYVGLG